MTQEIELIEFEYVVHVDNWNGFSRSCPDTYHYKKREVNLQILLSRLRTEFQRDIDAHKIVSVQFHKGSEYIDQKFQLNDETWSMK